MTPRQKKTRPPIELTDPRAIRALAHPARMTVIDELYAGRELTATECGEIAGLSASAMSYHLRALERAGIVERVESSGDGRERPWRAAGEYLRLRAGDGTAARAASAAFTESIMVRTGKQFEAWLARRGHEAPEWVEASGTNYGQVWLLPEEAREITDTVRNMLQGYRERNASEHPAGARRVRSTFILFPTDAPDSASAAP